MGFLRKVGRKIGKKLNKVFGSKLGPIVGAVGLYMLMGTVVKQFTGWKNSVFGGGEVLPGPPPALTGPAPTMVEGGGILAANAPGTVPGTAAFNTATTTSEAAKQLAITASPEAIASSSSGFSSVGAEARLSEQALLAGENLSTQAISASNLTQAEQIANMTNNMDAANSAISAIDSAAVSGSTNVSSTITESVIQDAIPAIEQKASVVQANIQQPTPSTFDMTGGSSQYHGAGADGYRSTISTASTSPTTTLPSSAAVDTSSSVIDTSSAVIDTATVNPDGIIISNPKTNFVATDDIIMDTAMEDTMNQAVIDSQKNLFAKGIDKVKGYFGDDFVGNTVQGVTTGMIMGELQGDYEEPFRSAGISNQIASEAAQGNYIQQVGSSAMAAAGLPRMPTFQELSQQTLYGTGSPNYLSQFYQPLATPRMG